MKPYPFASLNHFTVPVRRGIARSPFKNCSDVPRASRNANGIVRTGGEGSARGPQAGSEERPQVLCTTRPRRSGQAEKNTEMGERAEPGQGAEPGCRQPKDQAAPAM